MKRGTAERKKYAEDREEDECCRRGACMWMVSFKTDAWAFSREVRSSWDHQNKGPPALAITYPEPRKYSQACLRQKSPFVGAPLFLVCPAAPVFFENSFY